MSKLEKIENWDQFDEMVDQGFVDMPKLKGYISILEIREMINKGTTIEKIQKFLREEFNVEYSLEAIKNHFVEEEVTGMEIKFLEGQI